MRILSHHFRKLNLPRTCPSVSVETPTSRDAAPKRNTRSSAGRTSFSPCGLFGPASSRLRGRSQLGRRSTRASCSVVAERFSGHQWRTNGLRYRSGASFQSTPSSAVSATSRDSTTNVMSSLSERGGSFSSWSSLRARSIRATATEACFAVMSASYGRTRAPVKEGIPRLCRRRASILRNGITTLLCGLSHTSNRVFRHRLRLFERAAECADLRYRRYDDVPAPSRERLEVDRIEALRRRRMSARPRRTIVRHREQHTSE